MSKRILRNTIMIALAAALTLLFHSQVSAASAHKVYILSDSTAAEYDSSFQSIYNRYGWGMLLPDYLSEDLTVVNYGEPGRSSRSYLSTDAYQSFLEKVSAGDYVLIQFGHNDALTQYARRVTYPNIPLRKLDMNGYDKTTRHYSYEWFLYEKYIKVALDKGAYPILITPPSRLSTSGGANYTVLTPYRQAMIQLGLKYGVPVIDLGKSTQKLYSTLSQQGAKKLTMSFHSNLANGTLDYTHFSKTGANLLASMIAEQASKLSENGLSQYISVGKVQFSRSAVSVKSGASITPALSVRMNQNLRASTNSDYEVAYTSSRNSIFTVSKEGSITGIRRGTAYLTATVKIGDGTYTACTKVTVR